jgi:hypothetical protein
MGLKYRWMQKKDLEKIKNRKDLVALLKSNRTIANVIESNEEILGWIVYELINNKITIAKISFTNEEIAEEILECLTIKHPEKITEVAVSEYDLKFQLILKKNNFLAKQIKKINQSDFYIFVRNSI